MHWFNGTITTNMLNIAYEYSIKWRFNFNASKSCVLEFHPSKRKPNSDHVWYLGNDTISPQDTYNHLGILVNNKCNFSDRINSACRKGNITFYALSDIGSPYLNPLTIASMYKTVVRPSVLYGCELWNNLSAKDTQR